MWLLLWKGRGSWNRVLLASCLSSLRRAETTGKTHRVQLDHCSLYMPTWWHVTQCREIACSALLTCLVHICEIRAPVPNPGTRQVMFIWEINEGWRGTQLLCHCKNLSWKPQSPWKSWMCDKRISYSRHPRGRQENPQKCSGLVSLTYEAANKRLRLKVGGRWRHLSLSSDLLRQAVAHVWPAPWAHTAWICENGYQAGCWCWPGEGSFQTIPATGRSCIAAWCHGWPSVNHKAHNTPLPAAGGGTQKKPESRSRFPANQLCDLGSSCSFWDASFVY